MPYEAYTDKSCEVCCGELLVKSLGLRVEVESPRVFVILVFVQGSYVSSLHCTVN